MKNSFKVVLFISMLLLVIASVYGINHSTVYDSIS